MKIESARNKPERMSLVRSYQQGPIIVESSAEVSKNVKTSWKKLHRRRHWGRALPSLLNKVRYRVPTLGTKAGVLLARSAAPVQHVTLLKNSTLKTRLPYLLRTPCGFHFIAIITFSGFFANPHNACPLAFAPLLYKPLPCRLTSLTATYSDRKWSESGRQLGLVKNPSLVNPGGSSIAMATTSTAPNHRLRRLEQQMSAGKHRAEGLLERTPGPAPSQNLSCHLFMKVMLEAHGWERRSRA